MAIDTSGLPFAKPEPRSRQKSREDRREAAIKKAIREQDVERDGYCRLQRVGLGDCYGPSEWAHLPGHRRFETLGKPPEERHTTAGTCMLCRLHHARLDGKARPPLDVELRDRGADGELKWKAGDVVYQEVRA